MSDRTSPTGERPTPPPSVPDAVADRIADLDPDTLRAVAGHAEALAAWKVRRDEESETSGDDMDAALQDAYAEIDIPPGKGTVTIKTINGNDYRYLQWRDGDAVRSKYVAPVENDGD